MTMYPKIIIDCLVFIWINKKKKSEILDIGNNFLISFHSHIYTCYNIVTSVNCNSNCFYVSETSDLTHQHHTTVVLFNQVKYSVIKNNSSIATWRWFINEPAIITSNRQNSRGYIKFGQDSSLHRHIWSTNWGEEAIWHCMRVNLSLRIAHAITTHSYIRYTGFNKHKRLDIGWRVNVIRCVWVYVSHK